MQPVHFAEYAPISWAFLRMVVAVTKCRRCERFGLLIRSTFQEGQGAGRRGM
jgi:hypothetical protein